MVTHHSLSDCPPCCPAVTPPGYKTVGDVTDACDAGSYRAEWKPADQAGSCDLCGDNILSDPTDEITSIDISDYTSTSKVFVRASASACCEWHWLAVRHAVGHVR